MGIWKILIIKINKNIKLNIFYTNQIEFFYFNNY